MKLITTISSIGLLFTIGLVLAGCPSEQAGTAPAEAVAELHPTEGNMVQGTVTFTTVDNGVRIVADLTGIAPGQHGFHIHEEGDCSAADATSAGGHYNPGNVEHGGPNDAVRHVGDLGNIEAGPDSTAHYERVDSVISLGGPQSIIGKAVIVHAGEDDLTTQPTGDAGARLACGVILAEAPEEATAEAEGGY